MNISFIKACLFSSMMAVASIAFSQDIRFNYDASGNRISRILVFKEGIPQLNDSLVSAVSPDLQNQETENLSITVFPNPASGFIQIQSDGLAGEINLDAYFFSSKGELLSSFKINSSIQKINLEKYAPGLYFLKIPPFNKVESWKIIKH